MSTQLPDSPMLLDSTGRAMVDKLERIRNAILNGGGGGGASFTAPPYDASIARHGSSVAYRYGDYCTYDSTIYRCIVYGIYVSDPPVEFNSEQWEAIESLATELSSKPGRIVDDDKQSESFNNIANNVSSGYQSHAEGNYTQATNDQAHAEGQSTTASGYRAHAEGYNTRATGSDSHAEGNYTEATNYQSHAEGSNTHATGGQAHAEGSSTYADGSSSHAEGAGCHAVGSYSHAEGSNTYASSYASHAEGSGSVVLTNSENSHAEGYNTKAGGTAAHAEGYNSKALSSYAHAEGYYSEANGVASHAQGMYTKANTPYSFASGYYSETKAAYEQSLGMYNKTIDDGSTLNYYNQSGSYAVGDKVKLGGDETHSIYQCNTAIAAPAGEFDSSKWTVIGVYDSVNPILFSVGNGTYSSRKNAVEIRRDGTFYLNGNELPKPPSTDGTYTLQCTVSNGTVTYSWV